MTFRVSALASAAVVLGLGAFAPVSAQPQAPIRPRSSTFSSIFTPGLQQQQLMQQQFIANAGLGFAGPGGLIGPAFGNPGLTAFGGLGYPGSLALPQVLPGALAANPQLPRSGIVGTFYNYGHWYNMRGSGYYSHWYPNGITNGRGALGNGMGGGFGGFSGGGLSGGGPIQPGSGINSLGGTALGVGATLNQLRR